MMALSATSRDGVELQGTLGYGLADSGGAPHLPIHNIGPKFRHTSGYPRVGATVAGSLMDLGADGDPLPTRVGMNLMGLLVGAAVTAGITAWTFSASRDGSNIKPGLVAGGTYLAGGLLIAALGR